MNMPSKSASRLIRGLKRLPRIAMMGVLFLALLLAVTACGSQETRQPIKASWITPQVSGDTVSILVSEVEKNTIVHFKVPVSMGGGLAFMAYDLDGKLNVRANVCPPCRSVGFSLNKDTLVCDTCRTTFKARTGEGISGACVDYPKAAVAYEITNGKAVMSADSLITSYRNTIEPGQP